MLYFKKPNLIQISFIILVLIYSANTYEAKAANTPKVPCKKEIFYSIDKVDPGFNIDTKSLREAVDKSANLWNSLSNDKVFSYKETGAVKISLVYDHRQKLVSERLKRKSELESNVAEFKYILNRLNLKKSSLENLSNSLKKDGAIYEAYLTNYNKRVSDSNKTGYITPDEANLFNGERVTLQKTQSDLVSKFDTLKLEIANLNKDVNIYNSSSTKLQNKIITFNKAKVEDFEQGNYNANDNKITVYEFENINNRVKVLTHELGHSLGIDHVTATSSIMYFTNITSSLTPSTEDINEFAKSCNK